MPGDLVFITGGTGHVGFAVLVDLLKAGYIVRASVRRAEQGDMLKTHELVKPFAEHLEIVVVQDITGEGAFDKALEGVSYIEHIASPLPRPTEDPENEIIIPAINGTTSILRSAAKVSTIRRVVITSSGVAVIPRDALINGDDKNIYTPYSRVRPLPTAPWGSFRDAYQCAKILSLDATEKFIAEQEPQFTIVNIMPGFVIGPNRLNTSPDQVAKGSNAVAMAPLLGGAESIARPCTISTIDDLARVHVGCLDEKKVIGNQNFFVPSPKMTFNDSMDIAEKYFPEAIKDGLFPLGGNMPPAYQNLDGSETIKIFGPMETYEHAVKQLIEQYLELKEKSQ